MCVCLTVYIEWVLGMPLKCSPKVPLMTNGSIASHLPNKETIMSIFSLIKFLSNFRIRRLLLACPGK